MPKVMSALNFITFKNKAKNNVSLSTFGDISKTYCQKFQNEPSKNLNTEPGELFQVIEQMQILTKQRKTGW